MMGFVPSRLPEEASRRGSFEPHQSTDSVRTAIQQVHSSFPLLSDLFSRGKFIFLEGVE